MTGLVIFAVVVAYALAVVLVLRLGRAAKVGDEHIERWAAEREAAMPRRHLRRVD